MYRALTWIVTTVAMLLCLADAGQAQQKTLSVWWTEIDPASIKVMEKVIAEYEKEHPNVKVKLESIAWGALFQRLVASIGTGSPPDLTHLVPYMVDSLYRKNQLVPMTDVVKALGETDIDEPARLVHLNEAQYYGLAYAMGTSHWNYRADLFKEKGLKFPPTTWGEVLQAAQVLSTPERPAVTLVGEPFYIDFWFGEFLMNNGGRFVDPKTFKPAFTDRPFIETLAFFRDLSKYAQKGWANQKFLDTFVLFATDKTAIYPVNFNRLHLFIKKYAQPRMANSEIFAPALPPRGPSLPAGEKTKVLFDAEPWAIIKGAKNVQEAKDFLKVYYRKDLYREMTLTVPLHLSPVLKSIADDPNYEKEPAIREWRSWYEVMRTALRENRAAPLLMTSVLERNPIMLELQGSKVISDMVLDVIVEGRSPEEAAAKGQKKAEELIARLGWKKW